MELHAKVFYKKRNLHKLLDQSVFYHKLCIFIDLEARETAKSLTAYLVKCLVYEVGQGTQDSFFSIKT